MDRLDNNSFTGQWECPGCWWCNLDYQSAEIDENTVSYAWTCWDCGSQWVEWYVMEFYSQNLTYDWTKKMSTDDPDWQRDEV